MRNIERARQAQQTDYEIGCILLEQPFFFAEKMNGYQHRRIGALILSEAKGMIQLLEKGRECGML